MKKGDIKLGPIYQPISYEQKYDKYLNNLIVGVFKQFQANIQSYNKDDITQSDVATAFNNALAKFNISVPWIDNYFRSLKGYHDKKFATVLQKAINDNIMPYLSNTAIDNAMQQAIAENVSLIKTIGTRLHDQVTDVIYRSFTQIGVDQEKTYKEIIQRFSISKSNAKRIARDQTSKAIASFTQIRHAQIGITEYQWLGVGDNRERQTHLFNNNKVFAYANPPSATGNPGDDINCRCVSLGILPKAQADKLKKGDLSGVS